MSKRQSKFKENLKFASLCFLIVSVTLAICGGAEIYSYLKGFSRGKGSLVKPKVVSDKNSPVNILLMGLDIGSEGSNSDSSKRTDTLILLNYQPKAGKLNLISIPRDTLIEIKGKNEKINSANVYGGVPWVIDSVEQLLDVKVNYYGKLNYEGFRKIIDTIGGIDMTIDHRMNYDDPSQNLHIHFNKGETVHLDGKKAEEFFRWRKNNDGTGLAMGDLDRINNQHVFVSKVIERFTSAAIIPKLPEILRTVPQYVETNMDANDLIKYGFLFSKVDTNKVTMTTIKGDVENIDGASYFIYDENKSKDVTALLN